MLNSDSHIPKNDNLITIDGNLKSEYTYLETQKVGSCAFRSCHMIYYIVMYLDMIL